MPQKIKQQIKTNQISTEERLANSLLSESKFDLALVKYLWILKNLPTHTHAILASAHCFRYLGRYEEAKKMLHSLDKLGIVSLAVLGEWLALSNGSVLEYNDIEAVKKQIDENIEPRLFCIASMALRANGDFEFSKKTAHALLAKTPLNFDISIELSRVYQDLGEPNTALEILDGVLDEDKLDKSQISKIWFEKGQCFRLLRRLDIAISAYNTAILLDDSNLLAKMRVALLDVESGNFENAENKLLSLLKETPSNDEALLFLTKCRIMSRRINPWFDAMEKIELHSGGNIGITLQNRVNRAVGLYLANYVNDSLFFLNKSREILKRKDVGSSAYFKAYWVYVYKLIGWRAENQSWFGIGKESGLLHVVGESHAIAANFGLVTWHNNRILRCVSHWIPGCKQWHLSSVEPNCYKSAIKSITSQIPNKSDVMFCIGEIDTRPDEGIWIAAQKSAKTIKELVTQTVKGYVDFLYMETLDKQYTTITVQGIPAPGYGIDKNIDEKKFLEMIYMMNQELKSQTKAKGWYFLDVYTATADNTGYSNKKWHLDGRHLQPGFYAEADKWFL